MSFFDRLTDRTVKAAGSVPAVLGSVALVAAWAGLGPAFHWSEGHQLFINTVTTVITFWLCFLVLRSQNRSEAAIQVKLDALIKAIEAAPNRLMNIERATEEEIEREHQAL